MNVSTIATLANKQKKQTKKEEAFSILLSAISSDSPLTESDAAKLYSFFGPKGPKAAKTAREWVNRAVSIKDVRYYLNTPYMTGKKYVCTDGHRMHWIMCDDAAGFIDLAGNRIEVDGKYPDIERVIPKDNKPVIVDVHGLPVSVNDKGLYPHYKLPASVIDQSTADRFNDHTKVCIQKKYFDDAIKGLSDVQVFTGSCDGPVQIAGTFNGTECHAVLMSIKI